MTSFQFWRSFHVIPHRGLLRSFYSHRKHHDSYSKRRTKWLSWIFIFAGSTSTIYYGHEWWSNLGAPTESLEHRPTKRPHLVVLGSGWASIGLLKNLRNNFFDITIISPRNYFLFTPLLLQATTGTVEIRSIVEPVRKICRLGDVKYFEARAFDLDTVNNEVHLIDSEGQKFALNYDYLVIGVGAKNNTFGTPGVEQNAQFLKEIGDARQARSKIMECFEKAALPTMSEVEKRKLLHFIVVGGGPTGVELAAELHDFFREDLSRLFPELKEYVKVTLFQSADHVLNTYDRRITDYTEHLFAARNDIQLITNARVLQVDKNKIVYKRNLPLGNSAVETVKEEKARLAKTIPTTETLSDPILEEQSVDFGICFWATGIQPHTFIRHLTEILQSDFPHARALTTDEKLRVLNTPGNVFAAGDCATIKMPPSIFANIEQIFKEFDLNNDGILSFDEVNIASKKTCDVYPQLCEHMEKLKKTVLKRKKGLNMNEFNIFLAQVTQKMKPYPATAQVAMQQGKYLAHQLDNIARQKESKPFQYSHFGSFVYLGQDTAAIEFNLPIPVVTKGMLAYWLWRSAYWSRQISSRTKTVIAFDWMKKKIFGRDISQF